MNNKFDRQKLDQALNLKADKSDLENITMTSCNRNDLNNLSEKVGMVQHELSEVKLMFNDILNTNIQKGNKVKPLENKSKTFNLG